jgi:transcriptional regulator with GAF, ATPase, and Fis domain
LKDAMKMCTQIAPLDTPVLLLGETGVGKDLLATTVHNYSTRSQGPFVAVNCGAIAETLLDSELFGHEKGAFTGAINQKAGRFERADKGTIYLDEIGELTPQGQVRLLRVIQYKEIERVGGTKPIRVDARIIAATNRNLEEMVKSGEFRQDLWYRLNVFPILIPPLRQRKQDVADLTLYFVDKKRKELKLDITPRFPPNTIELLMEYSWPGNVRELQNVIERALITNRDGLLPFDELITIDSEGSINNKHRVPIPQIDLNQAGEMETLDQHTCAYIQLAMTRSEGKINGAGRAAELLGIHPNTLRKKMDKLGIPYKKKI